MKTRSLAIAFVCMILAATSATFAKALPPIQEARQHLEHAQTLIAKKEAGGKAGIPAIIAALAAAETSLGEAKKNKGTTVNIATKMTGDAKAELEAAKGEAGGEHMKKAEELIQGALKHVMDGIRNHS